MELETFLNLPTTEVARIVREAGPKVCVFPINGTRRWLVLEYPELVVDDFARAYFEIGGQRHIALYKLFFDHGIETLLTPVFGPELLDRGDEYNELVAPGLLWFTENPAFLQFYEAYDVHVSIYGDAQRYFKGTSHAHLLQAFEELSRRTAHHRTHRLFLGICAHDATESVAEIGIRFYQEQGYAPNRRQIVEAYYGEYVDSVDFFIGFDRPTAFDMPLIATGNEDLYFTVSPSPYLDAHTLRLILYDHLYTRRLGEEDYAMVGQDEWRALAQFYAVNRHHVLGVGRRDRSGNFWIPLPQVTLPDIMAETGE